MRIVCEKCSAAYAIDDKFVTAKGVRAQCPRCRTLQLVKKDLASVAAPAVFSPNALPSSPKAPELHFGQIPVPPGVPSPAAPFAFDLGTASAPPPSGQTPAAVPPGGFDFGSLSAPPPPPPPPVGTFDFGGLQPAAPPSSTSAADMLEFADPPQRQPVTASGPAPVASSSSWAPVPAAAEPSMGSATVRCRSCGQSMSDPFDQALGTCDDCRNRSQELGSGPVLPDSGAGRVEHVAVSAIHASLHPETRPAPAPPLAPPPAPVFGPVVNLPDPGAVKSAARDGIETGSRRRSIGVAVVVLAVLGGGALLVLRKPWSRRAPMLVSRAGTSSDAKQPVDALIQQWKLNFPELAGASSKQARSYLDNGEALLVKDTTSGYLDAEEEFQKALVLDPSLDRAVAGWALSIAFGRGAQLDEQTARAAESLLVGAEKRGAEPRVFVAHAHLMITRGGNPNDIKVLADRGRTSPDVSDRALAALALGQTFLVKNPQQADESFKEALRLDPTLKRCYFFQAQLATSQGRYRDAIGSLERRLDLDKDQWEAAEELARLYVDVGELARAKKVLENARLVSPSAGRPRLELAILEYQHLGDPGRAQQTLTALVNDATIPRAERADAWVHLAAIARLGGDHNRATEAVDQALELAVDSVPARLQRFLVLVERNIASSARLEFEALRGKLGDPQLEAALDGRLMLAENRLEEAIRTLAAVYEADPRRVDALLLAGAAAARARKDGKAWELCLKKGLRADPHVYPVASLTRFPVRPLDLLKSATGAYEALSTSSEEDPNPALCGGLVAWFSGDLSAADRAFSRVSSIDPRNADAYAYRALIALNRKDVAGAAKLVARGLDSSKSNALVYLAQAQLAALLNKPDAEKTAANQALKVNGSLLSARTSLGEAEARLKQPEEARRALTNVLLMDPLFRDAKRVLYKQEL